MAPFTGGTSIYAGGLVGGVLHDGFAGLWLLIYNIMTGRSKEVFRSLNTWPGKLVCIAAVFGGPLAMGGYLLGIKFAGAAYAMGISALYPVVGAVLAQIVLKERITPRVWIGILACVIGAFIMGYAPPEGDAMPNFYLGLGCAAVAAFGWGVEGVLSTYGMDMVDPAVAINLREATSSIVSIVFVLPFVAGLPMLIEAFSHFDSLWLLAIAGLVGGASYLCWYRGFSMCGVGRTMALNITYAIWGLVFSYFMTDVELTANLVVGALVITAGAILIVANPKEILNLRSEA